MCIRDRARGEDKPGIVLIRTLGVNQHNQVVLQYERKIMVGYRGDRLPITPAPTTPVDFPWVEHPVVDLPITGGNYPAQLTDPNTYFEDFALGDLIVHANGRTITCLLYTSYTRSKCSGWVLPTR